MFEGFFSFLMSNWPEATVVIILLIAVGIACWRLAKYHSSLQETQRKVNNLPCESHKGQGDEIRSLKEIVTSTNDLVVEISRWIAGKDKSMIGTLIKKGSPYFITSIGKEILEESGGKKVIDENTDFFIREMEALNPQTPYDVEDQAFNVVFKNVGSDIYNPVKSYIYYSPDKIMRMDEELNEEREVKISMPSILNVMGIYLRDIYFLKHPEIERMPEL